jgi:hypothetical protein
MKLTLHPLFVVTPLRPCASGAMELDKAIPIFHAVLDVTVFGNSVEFSLLSREDLVRLYALSHLYFGV